MATAVSEEFGMAPLPPSRDRFVRSSVRYISEPARRLTERNPQSQSRFEFCFFLTRMRGIRLHVSSRGHACKTRASVNDDAARPFRAPVTQRRGSGQYLPLFTSSVEVKIHCARYSIPRLPNREKDCQTACNNAEIILLMSKEGMRELTVVDL